MTAATRNPLIFIFVTRLLDSMGFGIVMPVLPQLLLSMGAPNLSVAVRTAGVLLVVYSVLQFLCGPVIGNLSDRFGRRPVDPVFTARIRHRLPAHGVCAQHRVVVRGPRHRGHCRRRVCAGQRVYRRCHSTGEAGASFWSGRCGIRHGFHSRPGHRRTAGRNGYARAFLCRGCAGGTQRAVRFVRAPRIFTERTAPAFLLVTRQSAGHGGGAVSLSRRAGPGVRDVAFPDWQQCLSRAPGRSSRPRNSTGRPE